MMGGGVGVVGGGVGGDGGRLITGLVFPLTG